eukprot:2516500-Prymnesium_polylepis.1
MHVVTVPIRTVRGRPDDLLGNRERKNGTSLAHLRCHSTATTPPADELMSWRLASWAAQDRSPVIVGSQLRTNR